MNFILEGKVAAAFFIAYMLLVWTIFQHEGFTDARNLVVFGLSLSVTCVVPFSGIATRSAFLGSLLGISVLVCFGGTRWTYFGWYLASLSVFHFSEYIMVALYRPTKLTLDSFLLNQSAEYQIAALASWIEFALELWLFPEMKNVFTISFVGLVLMVLGEGLRKLAMITAGSNFTHHVQSRKEEGHVLVTHGIYSLCRHPGYVGWFWWSLGTELDHYCEGSYFFHEILR